MLGDATTALLTHLGALNHAHVRAAEEAAGTALAAARVAEPADAVRPVAHADRAGDGWRDRAPRHGHDRRDCREGADWRG